MSIRVTKDEKICVPLYHGTSKLFLPSIQKSGLGAKDPNSDFKSLDLLTELNNILGWHTSDDPELIQSRQIIGHINDQSVTSGGFNFRHGSTYLALCQATAVRYALSNRFGSELLSTAISLLKKLEYHDKQKARRLAAKYPSISRLLTIQHQPMLVEALEVPIDNLRSETGKSPDSEIHTANKLADGLPSRCLETVWQQINFELVHHLHLNHLKFYDIRWDNTDTIFPRYTLQPIHQLSETL